jgi:hypothetical protein
MQSHRTRIPLMAMGMIALLSALWAGLVRMGWALPSLRPTLPGIHGPLMVSGFLGTLISLERAVALKRRWTYLVPLLAGVGSLMTIIGVRGPVGPMLLTMGSLGLIAIFVAIFRLQAALHTATIGVGAVAWFVGNVLWLAGSTLVPASQIERPGVFWWTGGGFELAGWPVYAVVPWWIGFLVLTIAGERLELSRLLQLSRTKRAAFVIAAGVLLASLIVSGVMFDVGVRLAGVGMILLAAWLLTSDIARRTVKTTGLTRFIAVSLLSGYVWLGASGLLALVFGGVISGPQYDAILHAVFLGFVFAMIFAHAPIIFPAVLGRPMAFRSVFYVHLVVLHLSLILRVAGDLLGWLAARRWGGLINVFAIVLFLVNTLRAVRQAHRERT